MTDVIKSIFPVFVAINTAGMSQNYFPDVERGAAAVKRAFGIIHRRSLIDSSSNNGVQPPTCSGTVEFSAVDFFYPQRPDVQIFRNFNLKIPSGTSVALVGTSGSGKSTVVGLSLRF